MKLLTASFLFLLFSCASVTPVSEYETFNSARDEFRKRNAKSEFISNYNEIPKFPKLRRTMAPGHIFSLKHPSDDKLKGRFRVAFDGTLVLPYGVRIKVNGLTFAQLRAKVFQAYSKFFQRGVDNVEFKLLYRDYWVDVRGFVKKSGRYLVTQTESIDKVIDRAGGLNGDLKSGFYKASIQQQDKSYVISLNQYFQNNYYSNAFVWTGGDSIFVAEQDENEMSDSIPIVSVLGGVNSPGKVLYKEKANLFYYLGKSGGVIPNLATERTLIVRQTKDGLKKIRFDLSDTDSIPHIYPQDTIILQSDARNSKDRLFDRSIQILSIITSIALILAI
ncbi:MAG: hypothetical protein CME65_07485 [Halobacteriovoraceae bacterium]|nr:hypothetical protein [Halobacteriovoraceae bacterium]|tara:strand:+ start:20506 stop:21504 length:999 start_codon:yes stop_codon:yes gene_type:complete